MTDEEVGELWRAYADWWQPKIGENVRSLIRKLVEERQLQYVASGNSLECALRDFGIDPKTWK